MKTKNLAIVLFDDVEVLDFCGPFEVFSVTGGRSNQKFFDVFTVAAETAAYMEYDWRP
jgi:hypothetical protein